MKLTRHNGRSGKHGTYNPRHNDRRFALKKGAKFIRPMMLVVLVLLLGKIVSDAVL